MIAAHLQSAQLATAALIDLTSRARAMQAAILRGAGPDEIERLRQEARDVAEAYLDHTIQAAQVVRQIIPSD